MYRWNLTVAVLLGALAVAPSRPLAAQDCTGGNLPDDSHEAEIFRIRGASTAFGRALSPVTPRRGSLFAMFEVTTLATIDKTTATPTYCRPGKPAENVNLMSVLPRPRVIFGLSDGFTFEASWIPPVTVNDVKANVFSVALARSVPAGMGIISLRANATFGEIRAPITCTESQIAVDPLSPGASECAGGAEPSNDHYKPNGFGGDLTYGWPAGGGRIRPYLGAGVNFLHPRFQVDFTDQFDVKQDQKVEGDFTRFIAFTGATWVPTARFSLTGEFYTDPGTTWVARLGMAYGVK